MEYLAPPLVLAIEVRLGLENQRGVRETVEEFINCHSNEFSKQVSLWLDSVTRGVQSKANWSSYYQRALIGLLGKGINGFPILTQLKELENEMIFQSHRQLDKQLSLVSIKSLLPLMLFQFPAFLLLILGPFLDQLQVALG